MTLFEKILLGLLSGAPSTATIFVHSPKGLLVLNASEDLLAGARNRLRRIGIGRKPAPLASQSSSVGQSGETVQLELKTGLFRQCF